MEVVEVVEVYVSIAKDRLKWYGASMLHIVNNPPDPRLKETLDAISKICEANGVAASICLFHDSRAEYLLSLPPASALQWTHTPHGYGVVMHPPKDQAQLNFTGEMAQHFYVAGRNQTIHFLHRMQEMEDLGYNALGVSMVKKRPDPKTPA